MEHYLVHVKTLASCPNDSALIPIQDVSGIMSDGSKVSSNHHQIRQRPHQSLIEIISSRTRQINPEFHQSITNFMPKLVYLSIGLPSEEHIQVLAQ